MFIDMKTDKLIVRLPKMLVLARQQGLVLCRNETGTVAKELLLVPGALLSSGAFMLLLSRDLVAGMVCLRC